MNKQKIAILAALIWALRLRAANTGHELFSNFSMSGVF